MATSNNNEITVKIKCSFEELEMMLKRQCFKELNKYSTTDIFLIPNEIDIKIDELHTSYERDGLKLIAKKNISTNVILIEIETNEKYQTIEQLKQEINKIDIEETSIQAIIREVYEEIGIELSQGEGCLLGTVQRDNYFRDVWKFKKILNLVILSLMMVK